MKELFALLTLTLLTAGAPLSAAGTPSAGQIKVLAFAGSARAESYNRLLVKEAAAIAGQMGAQVTVIDLKDYEMPLYDGDFEVKSGMPEAAKRLRAQMRNADVILISSPEHNGSIPAMLKNALDWTSRSEQGGSARGDVYKGKIFAIMSASPGKGGGKRALTHLRFVLEDIGATVISEQVSIPVAHEYFADKQKAENLALKTELEQAVMKQGRQ